MKGEVNSAELELLNRGICPTCRGRGFVVGPQGGMSINIECAQITCRERYNVAFLSGKAMRAERIEKRSEGGPAWPSEPFQ
jgi:hypothetical protein